jgi:hypothetical protein
MPSVSKPFMYINSFSLHNTTMSWGKSEETVGLPLIPGGSLHLPATGAPGVCHLEDHDPHSG